MTLLDINSDVQRAVAAGKAVVALESTIIAFGLPWPQNEQTALECERLVREAGATPATVGVVEGRLKVGLNADEIGRLARARGVAKVNLSNLAAVCARGGWGATTVSATLFAADAAGIRVFATGGIGGVHRNLSERADVSADLGALARWRCIVVCSGAKSVLDVRSTRELLESLGVPVLGYRTDRFPLFFTPDSDIAVDARVESPEEAAAAAQAHWALGLPGSVLCAQPVAGEHALERAEVDRHLPLIEEEFARRGDPDGRGLTPFLLARLAALTGGRSLEANLALIRRNAALAAAIAKALEQKPTHLIRSAAERKGAD
ncbi:MAG: pseudouridine-5'-phosphate glycosidase [Candidatus Sumerlaeia bacterium]